MNNQFTDQTVMEKIAFFYQERISILQEIELSKLLQQDKQFPFLLWENNAVSVVRKLLDNFLEMRQGWWQDFSTSPQFSFDSFLLRDSYQELRFKYEFELGCAETRLVRIFVKNYCAPDYSIDWQKLLRLRQA